MRGKKVIATVNCLFILILSCSVAQAGLFGDSVPKGKEIKDPYLEQLFAPEFPYESIKVIETNEGKRYVIIKAKEKVTHKKRIHYEDKTIRNKGIVVFESGSPRTDVLSISEMRLYRVVSEVPYVVEYCEVKGNSLQREPGVESVVRDEGKYLIILVNKSFGKVFKKVELYPEKEISCPEPPFVGKYPNSKSISCRGGNQGISFVYVTKDKGQEVYDYYRERLKTHYKNVGLNFPEESWKFSGAANSLGMQIKSSEVARVGIYLEPLRKEASITPPSLNGVVFHIEIIQIGLNPVIKNFSLIRIFYCTNSEKINTNIQQMKTIYPEGMK
jgi:hypothetical protein